MSVTPTGPGWALLEGEDEAFYYHEGCSSPAEQFVADAVEEQRMTLERVWNLAGEALSIMENTDRLGKPLSGLDTRKVKRVLSEILNITS